MVREAEWVEAVRRGLPELPTRRRARFESQGLDPHLAAVLSDMSPPLRDLYDGAVDSGAPARQTANWVTGEVNAWAKRSDEEGPIPLTGGQLAELVEMVEDGTVSSSAAKEILDGVLAGEGSPRAVAESRDLTQISDTSALEAAIEEVVAANPEALASSRGGESKALGVLVGQVMRATQGKADPKLVNEILVRRLAG
jgi:aspartyl-tRNA(Asn)/glutamyl-tRNA(Gln) amidotransferase subunit B